MQAGDNGRAMLLERLADVEDEEDVRARRVGSVEAAPATWRYWSRVTSPRRTASSSTRSVGAALVAPTIRPSSSSRNSRGTLIFQYLSRGRDPTGWLRPRDSLEWHPRQRSADAGSSLPPPPPMMIASSMQGSKDIVVEDQNKTGYAVISPKAGWKPSAKGTKDIILENDARDGSNYGVVPAAAIDEGGILTLDLKLTHK